LEMPKKNPVKMRSAQSLKGAGRFPRRARRKTL
jgi:hypothetical protein